MNNNKNNNKTNATASPKCLHLNLVWEMDGIIRDISRWKQIAYLLWFLTYCNKKA